jgi:hypothetical protein
LFSSKIERYEDVFLLFIYLAWSSVKRWVLGEKKATEEGRKESDAENLGMKRWPEDRMSENWQCQLLPLLLCSGHHLPRYTSK